MFLSMSYWFSIVFYTLLVLHCYLLPFVFGASAVAFISLRDSFVFEVFIRGAAQKRKTC